MLFIVHCSSHLLYGSQLWGHTNLKTKQNTEATEQSPEENFYLKTLRFYQEILQRITNLKIS